MGGSPFGKLRTLTTNGNNRLTANELEFDGLQDAHHERR